MVIPGSTIGDMRWVSRAKDGGSPISYINGPVAVGINHGMPNHHPPPTEQRVIEGLGV